MAHYKRIYTCGILLVALFVGCTSDASLKSQYNAERSLLKATKLHQRVLINPQIASDLDYRNAIAAYSAILKKYSSANANATISAIRKECYLSLAQLRLLQGELHAAIKLFDAFLQEFPDDRENGMKVRFANAQCNERIFNPTKAVTEYKTLLTKFGEVQDPLNPDVQILNLPLRIVRLENSNTLKPDGNSFYQEALDYYESVIQKWPGSPTAFFASYYIASIDFDQRKWMAGVRILNQLVEEYPDRKEIPTILLTLGNIYLDIFRKPNKALQIIEKLLVKSPDQEITGYAYFSKARVYIHQKKYALARDLLHWIIDNYPGDNNLGALAQLSIGATYEKQGAWDRALVEYGWVEEKYPVTTQGLQVPVYIAEHYRRKGEGQLAERAFQEAINQYEHLVKKYPKTVLAGFAQEYIIHCLSKLEKWQEAAQAANLLRTVYPSTQSNMSSYLFLGQIYEKAKQNQNAIDIYKRFVTEYPQHPMVSEIETKIKRLQKG